MKTKQEWMEDVKNALNHPEQILAVVYRDQVTREATCMIQEQFVEYAPEVLRSVADGIDAEKLQ